MSAKVWLVGAGPGDPELLTLKGRKAIEEASLVLYAGSLVPPDVVACAASGVNAPRVETTIAFIGRPCGVVPKSKQRTACGYACW